MQKYSFVKEVDNVADHLEGDEKYYCEHFGVDAFIGLYETFGGNTVYFGETQINKLRKAYIKQNYNGENIKELVKKLGCSDSFVRQAAKELFVVKRESNK